MTKEINHRAAIWYCTVTKESDAPRRGTNVKSIDKSPSWVCILCEGGISS